MTAGRVRHLLILALVLIALAGCAGPDGAEHRTLTDTTIELPTWGEIVDVLTLRRYNTRIVVIGTTLLGLAAGVIGSYMVLRRRALFGDALSHATLPGIGIAFLVMASMGGDGKSLPGLLLGAVISGLLGTAAILGIRRSSRIKEDAALGIVLSVFFGLGIAILGIIQKSETGNAAGLQSFISGKTASMLQSDVILIGVVAAAVILVCVLLAKEFAILSFDADFAASQGWPVGLLDLIMMALVTTVTVIGLQAVGIILIIALLIIPAAAARFWTDHLRRMLIVSGAIGACSGLLGATFSALIPRMPAGAIIVLAAALCFAVSLVFGTQRGLLLITLRQWIHRRTVARQHLLRALFEWSESHEPGVGIPVATLLTERSWSPSALSRQLASARRAGLLITDPGDRTVRLTADGRAVAAQHVRNHRLWELYLVAHADIAPSHVDRDADQIEHVLSPSMIAELEALAVADGEPGFPASPHALGTPPRSGAVGDER